MNNPNPIIPPGSVLEQKNKGRARVKLAVFFVLAIHVVLLGALLMQGCKKEESPTVAETNAPPLVETGAVPPELTAPPPAVASNLPPVVENRVPPALVEGTKEYVIAKGDSFYTIGKKFGVSIPAIAAANPNIDPNKLQIGQKIVIPAPPAATPATGGTSVIESTTGETIYTVKSGDTLIKIAADHGTTAKAIRAANNLTTDKIKVGQKLKIPAKSPPPPAP